jgi:hypothetical protein
MWLPKGRGFIRACEPRQCLRLWRLGFVGMGMPTYGGALVSWIDAGFVGRQSFADAVGRWRTGLMFAPTAVGVCRHGDADLRGESSDAGRGDGLLRDAKSLIANRRGKLPKAVLFTYMVCM